MFDNKSFHSKNLWFDPIPCAGETPMYAVVITEGIIWIGDIYFNSSKGYLCKFNEDVSVGQTILEEITQFIKDLNNGVTHG